MTSDDEVYDAPRRHLLLSFPDFQAGASGSAVLCRLVEAAIHHYLAGKSAASIVTVDDVRTAIKDIADLSFDSGEIIATLEALEGTGAVQFRHKAKRAFVLTDTRYQTLCSDLAYRQQRDDAVRKEWIDDVRQRHPLSDEALTALWQALDEFIARLMNTYAAEAAAFLYQADGGAQRFEAALSRRVPHVAELVGADLVGIALDEFTRFFDTASAARTDYLTHRLRSAFVFHLLNLDPAASALVQSHVSEKVFYLDTNFLFRLFGFDGPTDAYSPQAALAMAKALHCQVLVAAETEHEFIRRLRSEMKDIRQHAIQQETLQRVIATQAGDEYAFMRAYYTELLTGQVRTADQFENKYTNVRQLLSDHGITVDEDAELFEEEAKESSFLDQLSRFRSFLRFDRHPDSLDHDVFLLRWARVKRGKRDRGAGATKTWLLTYDRTLTRFSVRESTAETLPACLLADDWLQIARPFLPRTDNYDRSFVAMLRHPLASDAVNAVPLREMVEALERLDAVRDTPAPVLAAMISDGTIMQRVRAAKDQEAVRDLVDGEAVKYAKQLEEMRARLTQQNRELTERVEQVERVVEGYRSKLSDAGAVAVSVTKERDELRDTLETERRQGVKDVARAREEGRTDAESALDKRVNAAVVAALESQRRIQVRQRWCWAGATTLTVAVAAAMFMLPSLRNGTGWALASAAVVFGWISMMTIGRYGASSAAQTKLAEIAGILALLLAVILGAFALMPRNATSARIPADPTTVETLPAAAHAADTARIVPQTR